MTRKACRRRRDHHGIATLGGEGNRTANLEVDIVAPQSGSSGEAATSSERVRVSRAHRHHARHATGPAEHVRRTVCVDANLTDVDRNGRGGQGDKKRIDLPLIDDDTQGERHEMDHLGTRLRRQLVGRERAAAEVDIRKAEQFGVGRCGIPGVTRTRPGHSTRPTRESTTRGIHPRAAASQSHPAPSPNRTWCRDSQGPGGCLNRAGGMMPRAWIAVASLLPLASHQVL
ncbi:MAG: hypothetical protein ACKOES_00925, partial [Planctomycetaceae bacterium]